MKRDVLAWSLFAAILVMTGISLAYYFSDNPADFSDVYTLGSDLLWALLPVVFAFVAALVIARQPKNVIGWLLFGPALALANDGSFRAYFSTFSVPPPAPSPAFLAALWFYSFSWLLLIFPVFLILQLFPSGQPLNTRWRWVRQYVLVVFGYIFVNIAFSQTIAPPNLDWTAPNLVGFIPDAWSEKTGLPSLFVGLLSSTLLSAAALILRYRRGAALERVQIKWMLFACGIFALVYSAAIFGNLRSAEWGFGYGVLSILAPLSFMNIPAAIGIAILRYRLWDIDILIRRTLVYSLLSGLLALAYFGAVTILQILFATISGQSSAIAIVLSTLGIAALFNPLRRRIQVFIDRRFYRNTYNAEQALANFAALARHETDLAQLSTSLTRTIEETLQPERVTLWLKERPK